MDTETNTLDRPTDLYQHMHQLSSNAIYPSFSVICKPKCDRSTYLTENVHDNPVYSGKYLRRKRGRPRKHWSVQAIPEYHEMVKRKQEMPPQTFDGRRQSDPYRTVAMATHPNEELWSTNKRDITCSELINEVARKHRHVTDHMGTPVSDAHGCLECNHGNNTYCPYSRECRGNLIRLSHDQDTLLHEDSYHVPCHSTRNQLERGYDVTGHGYANYNSLIPSRSMYEAADTSPVIVECYSLAEGQGEPKVHSDQSNHPSISYERKSAKQGYDTEDMGCDLSYNQNYTESKQCYHRDGNCMVCHQIATGGEELTRYNPANGRKAFRYIPDEETRVIPVLPVLQKQASETGRPIEREDQNTCKTLQRSSPIRTQVESIPKLGVATEKGTIDRDYYEIYHSKYYKKNPKFHEENIKIPLEKANNFDPSETSPSSSNTCNGVTANQANRGCSEHIEANPAKSGEGNMQNKENGGVSSSFSTRESPSLHEDEVPPSESTSYDKMSNDACSPDSLVESVEENLEKNWNAACQEIFHQNSSVKGHSCGHCGREFTHLSSLNNHIRTHTGQKPFRCMYCAKRFAQSGVLTAHLRTHTGDRPFECNLCKKRFAQTTTLANHVRTHTGQKPFTCTYCKRKFAQSSTRNKHELSHTKEKPYTCKFCGKSFAQSATVTRHMRIHTRQDSYLCVHCGEKFPYLHALDKHLDSHNRQCCD